MFNRLLSNKFLFWLIFVITFLIGLHITIMKIYGYDFSRMSGDMGDSRFINTVLEHGYQWLCGNADGFWNGNFMYPEKSTITFSDNLIGNLPFYSIFRVIGLNEHSAFQGWLISVVFLNFACGFYAFRYFTQSKWQALLAAFLFTFSMALISQYFHIQMAVRFMVPLFFVFSHKYFDTGKNKFLFLAALSFVFQFYLSMYLGFFLLFCGAIYIAALFVLKIKKLKFDKNFFIGWSLAFLATGVLLLPLVWPYAERAKTTPFTPYDQVVPTIPTIWSYFRPFWDARIWPTFEFDTAGNPYSWLHLLFPGGLLMYCVILLPVTLYRKREKELLWFAVVGFIICFCFLRIGNFSAFEYISKLPGMGSLRMVTRVINILIFFFVIIFIYTTRSLFSSTWQVKNVFYFCLFMFLAVYDNKSSLKDFKKFTKYESLARVRGIENEVRQKSAGGKYKAFAILSTTKDDGYYNAWQIDAMLASYRLKMKTVNAYTSFSPSEFGSFWWQHNQASLNDWLRFKGADSSQVLVIYR
ncbi:MAG: hypothetical protein IAF38_02880 [Bacteroidia bacterium]|nr:hypothetical protein [Bacteroidia bacterium]